MNLQEQLLCFVQNAAGKDSKNETILKIDHFGKSIAHAKCAVWVKNFFLQKYAENESPRTIRLFCAKKTAGKNGQYLRNETILKMDHFNKSIAHAQWAV